MLKRELIAKVARENPHLARADIETMLDSIVEALARDHVGVPGADLFTLAKGWAVHDAASKRTQSIRRTKDVPLAIADKLDEINEKIESIL